MTSGGWINLTLSVGFVTLLFVWCLWRVLSSPRDPQKLAHVEPVDRGHVDRR